MYSQAVGLSKYNDWHPVINTLFSYKLPLVITNYWKGAPVLFQTIIFSLSLAYMALTLFEYGNYKYAKCFLIYIVLNPATLSIYLSSQKDSSFSIAMMLLMTFGVRVYFSKGAWLRNIKNMILFIIVLTAGTLFRHNAILFTLPVLFAVLLYLKKKQALLMLLCFMGLLYAIKYPLYESMNVQRPGLRQVETLGFSMSIIGNAVTETPERLDNDILDFAYSFASEDTWREKYETLSGIWSVRSSNEAKDSDKKYVVNLNVIEEAGWRKVIGMAFRCLRESPWYSVRGALGVTSVVYSIAGIPFGGMVPSIPENNLGLVDNNFFRLDFLAGSFNRINALFGFKDAVNKRIFKGEFGLRTLFILWNYATMVLLKHVFWCIGILNLVVIIFILAKLNFAKASDWKRLCLVLPMLVHNFGTMLIIQGSVFRIFYYSYLVLPLVLLVLLRDNGEAKS